MTTPSKPDKIPVGISSCLLGNEVRHNGGHKRDSYITGTLAEYFDLRPFCPEVGIGLGVPRPAIRLVDKDGELRVVGARDPDLDVTEALRDYTAAQAPAVAPLFGFILKKDSPSCGMERVKVYNGKGMPEKSGAGVFAAGIMARFPNLPVEEEGRLGDPRLRENFIQRVFVYHHWHTRVAPDLDVAALTGFHARLKLSLMSHDQDAARALGKLAASARADNLAAVAADYLAGAMACLRKVASRNNHVNVLQHIQGYLKKDLDGDDKAELVETIQQYHRGEVPLIVPVTLLRHHFRRNPDPYILNSWYLAPYPGELKLRNML
ncbi:MAG: DUF523 and DUF1722 domain-containing protein [Porticoccaceae bacterium]|nr:DUF523 and DUF1722 domain-containing protein [Pseudomonadota bacterium]